MSAVDFREVLGDAIGTDAWRVEKSPRDGGIELTIFGGPGAEEYANSAVWKLEIRPRTNGDAATAVTP